MFILAVFIRMTTFAVFRARAFNRSMFFCCIVWTLCHLCFSFCVIHLVIKTRQTKSVKRFFQIILHYLALVEGFEPSLEGLEDPCAIHYTIPALFGHCRWGRTTNHTSFSLLGWATLATCTSLLTDRSSTTYTILPPCVVGLSYRSSCLQRCLAGHLGFEPRIIAFGAR